MLAIDDEEDALTLLRVVLEAAGAEVTTVQLAARPRSSASEQVKPHVLVVDLGMPEMDGFELISRIRTSTDAGDSQHSRRRADGIRALGRSDQGVAQRLRDASRQARGSRRAGGIGRDVGEARQLGTVGRLRRTSARARMGRY